jgi:transcriptional repressor NrdR
MYCIFCQNNDTEVIETRVSEDGTTIRRRRSCPKCDKRFTTYERLEELPIMVIKRDGTRERFDREKLRRGLFKSCEKTIVTTEKIELILNEVERELKEKDTLEIESKTIGNLAAKRLKKIDKVAYIRFSSVFKRFVDLDDFEDELKKINPVKTVK